MAELIQQDPGRMFRFRGLRVSPSSSSSVGVETAIDGGYMSHDCLTHCHIGHSSPNDAGVGLYVPQDGSPFAGVRDRCGSGDMCTVKAAYSKKFSINVVKGLAPQQSLIGTSPPLARTRCPASQPHLFLRMLESSRVRFMTFHPTLQFANSCRVGSMPRR